MTHRSKETPPADGPEERRLVAVISVTHNSSHAIEQWATGLEQSGLRERMELCVVDSGSSVAEKEVLLETMSPRVDVLRYRPNIGYGAGSNLGARETSAPWLLFLNPDTRVKSLPAVIHRAPEPGDPITGAVQVLSGGRQRPLAFRDLPSARWEAEELVLGRWSRAYVRELARPAWISGAALLIARADFDRLGGFAPEIFLYFEDADLCARHVALGGSVRVDRRFVVDHAGLGSSRGVDNTALEAVGRHSARIFAARHGRPWHPVALYLILVVSYLPRRLVLDYLRRHSTDEGGSGWRLALELLQPRRAMRRLGVPMNGGQEAGSPPGDPSNPQGAPEPHALGRHRAEATRPSGETYPSS